MQAAHSSGQIALRCPSAIGEFLQSIAMRRPDRSRPVFHEIGDLTCEQSVGMRVALHLAAAETRDAGGATEADPQAAVARHPQGANGFRRQRGISQRFPRGEAKTIETHETVFAANPQISALVLRECPDGAAWQAVLVAPRGDV